MNQTCAQLQLERMNQMDCGFIETTVCPAARPEHAQWQGQVFHRGEAVTVDGVCYDDFASATGYGTGEGLCGWNCRHNFHPYFPGITEDEDIAKPYTPREMEQLSIEDAQRERGQYARRQAERFQRLEQFSLDPENRRVYGARAEEWRSRLESASGDQSEMHRRKIGQSGQQMIDKATYHKLTNWFTKSGGIIIRGENAIEHLKEKAYAAYLPGFNAAVIRDDATVSDVLEEMYHARQDRSHMFGVDVTEEVLLRREIDAQKYLLNATERYKIPIEEVEVTRANLKRYEERLEKLMKGE